MSLLDCIGFGQVNQELDRKQLKEAYNKNLQNILIYYLKHIFICLANLQIIVFSSEIFLFIYTVC